MNEYINLDEINIDNEHICCAISDKKHEEGVLKKKEWLKERIKEGHVFRKLNAQGKIFIEYAPLEKAWVPIIGKDYYYIYCLWVAGSFKSHGYGIELLEYAINDAKKNNQKGICVLSSKKKKPFISEKSFFVKYGFKVIDEINDYELLGLSFTDGEIPKFGETVRKMTIKDLNPTIYYSNQCPYTNNCLKEIKEYMEEENININLIKVDNLKQAKQLPCIFNNWAVFNHGSFISNTLLNKNSLKNLLNK